MYDVFSYNSVSFDKFASAMYALWFLEVYISIIVEYEC